MGVNCVIHQRITIPPKVAWPCSPDPQGSSSPDNETRDSGPSFTKASEGKPSTRDSRLVTRDSVYLRLAGLTRESVTDGPGLRAVVFVQGCPHRCPGCHNPETWPVDGGTVRSVDALWDEIKDSRLLRGVTYSGGEPFAQAGPLVLLGERIKDHGWDLFVYSGYTWEELNRRRVAEPEIDRLLALTDVLIDGPFLLDERDLMLPFRGSRNQRLLDVRRTETAGTPILWEPAW